MKEEKTTPLRQRMIEDMHIRGLAEAKTQKAHIRNVKLFAAFLGRSPDTATPEDLRAWQLQMTKDGLSPRPSTAASSRCGSSSASRAGARR
jgi:integrase/recombinase XerD